MTSYKRSSGWAAVLALGLAGLIGLGAAVLAAPTPARAAASAFELTLEATLTPPFYLSPVKGTFRSGAPFCARGTFVEPEERSLRFTCDDGTGGLTVSFLRWFERNPLANARWRILDGSGNYANLRGGGPLWGEPGGEIERWAQKRGCWRWQDRPQVEDELKLQFYYGGQEVYVLRSSEGPVVIPIPERHRDTPGLRYVLLTADERPRAAFTIPPRWRDTVSEILS